MKSPLSPKKTAGALLSYTLFFGLSATALGAGASLSPAVVPSQALTGGPVVSSQTTEPQHSTLTEVYGSVFLKKNPSHDFKPVQKGTILEMGDTLKTQEGRCEIALENHTSLSLGPQSVLEISEAIYDRLRQARLTRLNLSLGRLKAKIGKLEHGSRFEVATLTAIASVRGTVVYLNTGVADQKFTEIFVDESHGGVFFTNTTSGTEFLVHENQISSSFENGSELAPQDLSESDQKQFEENWNNEINSGISQEGNVEEEKTLNEGSTDPNLSEEPNSSTDASEDKKSEQNILGASETETTPATEDTSVAEMRMIREEIGRIRGDLDFEHADANLAQISDAQTGKVFTDVFGNRVRKDQYIFHESGSDTIQFLSLTARTGDYQKGVSAVSYGIQFNRGISDDTDIHSLPWNDYLNVVTNHEVAVNLGIPEMIQGNNGLEQNPDFQDLYDQYILHETSPELTEGPQGLFPVHFYVELTNPVAGRSGQDKIRFDETYSNPFPLTLQNQDDEPQNFVAQGQETNSTTIQPFQGDKLVRRFEQETHKESLSINDGPFVEENFNQNNGDNGGDGPQSANFAANFVPSNLTDINYYRNLGVNDDGDQTNDDHPMHFEDDFNDRVGQNQAILGRNQLIGVLIPIDDQGHVINQPGFNLDGIRDLLKPNPLVNNGGNYNLEVILMFGYRDDNGPNDLFHEDFRIDAIITPEIFQGFGPAIPAESIFPPSLREDDDDQDNIVI